MILQLLNFYGYLLEMLDSRIGCAGVVLLPMLYMKLTYSVVETGGLDIALEARHGDIWRYRSSGSV